MCEEKVSSELSARVSYTFTVNNVGMAGSHPSHPEYFDQRLADVRQCRCNHLVTLCCVTVLLLVWVCCVMLCVQDNWSIMVCNTAAMTMMTHMVLPGMVKK